MRHLGKAALIVALATGLAAAGASAQAQTPPAAKKAAAAPKARAERTRPASVYEVCETDIGIFCGDLESRRSRTTQCLKDNVAIVSTQCAAAIGGGNKAPVSGKKKK
jgi:hypothetical protein